MTTKHRSWVVWIILLCAALLLLQPVQARLLQGNAGTSSYLPLTIKPGPSPTPAPLEGGQYRANAPYLPSEDVFGDRISETAIFWFGRVKPYPNQSNHCRGENGVDVRVGYTDYALYVKAALFDCLFWYNPKPTPADLANWDSVTLDLDTTGNDATAPGQHAYKFVGQLSKGYEDREDHQTAYQGNGSGWSPTEFIFSTRTGSKGNGGFNTDGENRGWTLSFVVPFTSIGLSERPADGVIWGMALSTHDRDDANAVYTFTKDWPNQPDFNNPSTWGQVRFGLLPSAATLPEPGNTYSTTIRQGLDGAVVPDGQVGGGFLCGEGMDYWTEWGEYVDFYDLDPKDPDKERTAFNIGNGSDISDWPCFSKYFTIFPLDGMPEGKQVYSATLELKLFGSSGGLPGIDTLIQIMTIDRDFVENTLNYNNAPLAFENFSGTWVPASSFPGWPGISYYWDVTYAVLEAYENNQPLRIAIYSADGNYHSGRYFSSSDATDWDPDDPSRRPTLTIYWGNP